jgi:hypothetical protein
MEYLSIILGVIALLAAALAYYNTRTANRSLSARIDRLKDKNSILEKKLNDLRSTVGRSNSQPVPSNRPARPVQERPQQQPQPRPQQPSLRGEQPQPEQPRKPKENRRREPRIAPDGEQVGQRQPLAASASGEREIRDGERLAQRNQPEEQSGKKFAIIPEDGVIRQHQLQQQPDSDSYLEVDMPADGSTNLTRYRFNLAGNHAFVIAQGIDRLENAFSFEKPANRQVSQVVLRGDGVLAREGNGWKIQEKAQIDFT